MSGFADGAELQRVIDAMANDRVAPGYGPGAPDGQYAGPVVPDPNVPPPAPPAPAAPPVAPEPAYAPPPSPPTAPPDFGMPPPVAPPAVAPPPSAPPVAPPALPDEVLLPDGSRIAPSDLARIVGIGADRLQELAVLDHAFRTRPDVQQAVREAVSGGQGFFGVPGSPPPPAPPTALPPTVGPSAMPPAPMAPPPGFPPPAAPVLPSDVDPDDPTVRFILAQRAEMEQRIGQQQQYLAQEQSARLNSAVTRARHDAQAKYPNLTVDDWGRLEVYATQMGFAAGHYQANSDFYEAARFALETAAETIADPGIRSRLSSRTQPSAADTARRQAALSALAGTGAPATRTDAPTVTTMSREQKLNGMARELEAYAQGLQPS